MRHSLPDRSVTDETIEDAYVSFIFYCNPGVPPDVTTDALRDAFKTPPRSGGKSFSVYHLYQLICKLETKEIKTWAELALKLGVEPPDQESGQSSQKIQQYAVRLKRWMHSMHVDAFFDYLMSRQHPYWIDVPSEDCPVSQLERDGVAAKDDMALRALLPEIKPRRGRRRPDDEADQQLLSSMPPMQRSRLNEGVDESVGAWTTQSPAGDAYGFAAGGPASQSARNTPQPQAQQGQHQQQVPTSQTQQVARNSPLPVQVSSYDISDQRGSMSTSPGAPWPGGDMGTPLSYPQSALTPSSRHGFWDEESRSAGASPMKTSRSSGRRHGAKVVSSAWRGNNGATGSGKTRGRPPLNRVGSGNRSSNSPLSSAYPSIEQASPAAFSDAPPYSSHLHSANTTATVQASAPTDLGSVYTVNMQHMSSAALPSAPTPATYRPGRQGRISLQLPGQNNSFYQPMGGLPTVNENPPLDPITNTYVDSAGPSTYYGSFLGKLVEVEPLYFSNMLDTQFAGVRPPPPTTSAPAATSDPSDPPAQSAPAASSGPTAPTTIPMPMPPLLIPPSLIPIPGEPVDPTMERMAKEWTNIITANSNSNEGASAYFHMPFTFDQMQDRTNVDETLLYFLQMVFSADWYDAAGNRTGPGTWEEANGICETVMNNMIQTAPTYESFISSMAMISGSKVLMNHTRLLLKRGEKDATCVHFTVCWELRFGHIASRYNMSIQVPLPVQTRLIDRKAPPPIPPFIARKLGLASGARGSSGNNGGGSGGGGGGDGSGSSNDVEHSSKGRGPEPPPAMITTTTQIGLDGKMTQLPPKIAGASEMGENSRGGSVPGSGLGSGLNSGLNSGLGSGSGGAATTPITATNMKQNPSEMSMRDVLHGGIGGASGGGNHNSKGGGVGGPGGSSNGPGGVAMTPNGSEDLPQHYTPPGVSPEERARVWERRYRDLLRVVQRQEVQLEMMRAHIISGLREDMI